MTSFLEIARQKKKNKKKNSQKHKNGESGIVGTQLVGRGKGGKKRLELLHSQKSSIAVSVTNDQFILLQVLGNSLVGIGGKVNCREYGNKQK